MPQRSSPLSLSGLTGSGPIIGKWAQWSSRLVGNCRQCYLEHYPNLGYSTVPLEKMKPVVQSTLTSLIIYSKF